MYPEKPDVSYGYLILKDHKSNEFKVEIKLPFYFLTSRKMIKNCTLSFVNFNHLNYAPKRR